MNIYESYTQLRTNAFRSYWEKRILAQIGYLLELFPDNEAEESVLIEQAVEMLMKDYKEGEQISVVTAKATEKLLQPLSKKAKKISIICPAHAHIDMNWMWGYHETVALTLDTVRTMLKLMEEYPQFTFSQSQASVYRILEEYAPDLLANVKKRVQEGRWEVIASSWVENDKNLCSGEAMARHILYTKKYLSKLLEIPEESMNLDFEPDSFGHCYNIPEILQKGGVTRYYHYRGKDEGAQIYRWRSPAGTELMAYCEPRCYDFVCDCNIYHGVPDICKKYNISKALYVYGVGDHGGGPSRRDIERLIDMGTWPLFPEIKFGTYREFFDYLEERKEQFSVVEQELNYIFTGCYTSQSRIKKANSAGERYITEAEILGSMAKLTAPGYCRFRNLEEAWRSILFNQFHDILPGSGVVETREYAMGKFQEAIALAGAEATHAMDAICAELEESPIERDLRDTSMGAGAGIGTSDPCEFGYSSAETGNGLVRYYALFNVTQSVREEPIEITLWDWPDDPEHIRVTDMEGREYPFEISERPAKGLWEHKYYKILVWMPIPPVGYAICCVKKKEANCLPDIKIKELPRLQYITDEPIVLENNKVKFVFDASTMKCISFRRKSDNKEFVSNNKMACGFTLITEETSEKQTSWIVGKTSSVEELNEICNVRPTHISLNAMRKEIRYDIIRDNLKISVNMTLDDNSEELNFKLVIDWRLLGSKETGIPQLRFKLPCNYEVGKYRYAVPSGMIDRTSVAQDVPALGIGCALSKEQESSLYIISDCKYGFRGDKEGLSLDLIRGSVDPDPYPEVGKHVIRMAVGICDGKEETLALMKERYNHPVIVRTCSVKPHKQDSYKSLFHVEGAVLSAIKEAEDGNGWIVRVNNPCSMTKIMKLHLPGRKFEASLCDLLENNLEEIPVGDNMMIIYPMKSSEVASFRIYNVK